MEFVRDYIQLRFDGPCLTAYTLPCVVLATRKILSGDERYRDSLCERIGVPVLNVEVAKGSDLSIFFEDGAVFKISLRDEDYAGPEAVQLVREDGSICVI